MTDLTSVLPTFPTHRYARLLPSLERNKITTADLLTLDCVEIAKRVHLPLLDLKRLAGAVEEGLRDVLGVGKELEGELGVEEKGKGKEKVGSLKCSGKDLAGSWDVISTLDDELDRILGGGVPAGYITEVTGESGAGKTQFLLTLLLAAQLPSPQGLSGPALYVSTESALPTTRLSQLLNSHPLLRNLPREEKPTLDNVHSIVTADLETQDHILHFQVPVLIAQRGIRLLILDSVAANYRAEFERPGANNGAANMAKRSRELVKLGQLLRDIAREHNVAVVVANQVADRFSGDGSGYGRSSPMNRTSLTATQSSPLARRSGVAPSSSIPIPITQLSTYTPSQPLIPFKSTPDPLSLDHQQRWFTGWGDIQYPSHIDLKSMKTPSLGLVWSSQIACRIVLIKKPVYGRGVVEEGIDGEMVLKRWRRWFKVVFAGWVGGGGGGVKFEIRGEGIRGIDIDEEGEEEGEELPS